MVKIEDQELRLNHFLNKFKKAKQSFLTRTGPNCIWMNEKEDDTKPITWNPDLSTGIPTMARLLNDFERGIVCFAGYMNRGKSTLLVNMMIQSLKLNPDLMVLDLSLDDDFRKRMQQYLACLTGLNYQQISAQSTLSKNQLESLDVAESIITNYIKEDRLRLLEDNEKVIDGDVTKVYNMRKVTTIMALLNEVRQFYPNRKIAVFIDSWNDLDLDFVGTENQKANEAIRQLKTTVEELDIMCIMSTHLKKPQDPKSGVSIHDIKGTSDMGYAAVAAFTIANEYRDGREDALMYYDSQEQKRFPILIVEPVKTKVSSCDALTLYGAKTNSCQIIPLTRDEYKFYLDQYRNRGKK